MRWSTCGRYLVTDCAICGTLVLLVHATRRVHATSIPRFDENGIITPEIAAYVCHRRRCFLLATWGALPKTCRATEETL